MRVLPSAFVPPHDLVANTEHRAMDRQLVAVLAKAAGLERALAEFPDDVAAAAEQAQTTAAAIQAPTDPAAEPWPSMRPGVGQGSKDLGSNNLGTGT
ncbi:MAG TPA: hypothetical protein VFW75_06930 [Acetobacteraceae bacterium]|nr:hypothetical protein [Acetobacteraceae bacterium]